MSTKLINKMSTGLCGGKSEVKAWDEKAQNLLDKHKNEVLKKLNKENDHI